MKTLCGEQCKNGWTDQDAVWFLDLGWPNEEMSNYFDHLFRLLKRPFWWFSPCRHDTLHQWEVNLGWAQNCWKFNKIPENKCQQRHIHCAILMKFSVCGQFHGRLMFQIWADSLRGCSEVTGFKFGGAFSHKFSAPPSGEAICQFCGC